MPPATSDESTPINRGARQPSGHGCPDLSSASNHLIPPWNRFSRRSLVLTPALPRGYEFRANQYEAALRVTLASYLCG